MPMTDCMCCMNPAEARSLTACRSCGSLICPDCARAGDGYCADCRNEVGGRNGIFDK